MAIYLIDYENVNKDGLNGVSKLTENDKVIIFYSSKADRMTFGLHRRLNETKAQIEYRRVDVGGHNALDFQLATYLGFLVSRDPSEEYCIVSNDRGFEYLAGFWRKPLYNVTRTREIAASVPVEERRQARRQEKESLADGAFNEENGSGNEMQNLQQKEEEDRQESLPDFYEEANAEPAAFRNDSSIDNSEESMKRTAEGVSEPDGNPEETEAFHPENDDSIEPCDESGPVSVSDPERCPEEISRTTKDPGEKKEQENTQLTVFREIVREEKISESQTAALPYYEKAILKEDRASFMESAESAETTADSDSVEEKKTDSDTEKEGIGKNRRNGRKNSSSRWRSDRKRGQNGNSGRKTSSPEEHTPEIDPKKIEEMISGLELNDKERREISVYINRYKTKLGLNNALVRYFGTQKAGEIYKAIKPLIRDKKGTAERRKPSEQQMLIASEVGKLTVGLDLSEEDRREISSYVLRYKTKQGVNNALVRRFRSQKAGEVYKVIKPLLKEKKGGKNPQTNEASE